MSRGAPRLLALLSLSLLLASATRGQDPAGGPDVPPGPGAIHGRVLLAPDAEPVSGATVVLYALSATGTPGLRGAESDARGGFRFDGVSNDPATVYLIGTRHRGVPYGTRATFGRGQLELAVDLEVSEPSPDARAVVTGAVQLRADRGCEGIHVIETWELRNPTDRVVFVPEADRDRLPPVFRTRLPEGAVGGRALFESFQDGLVADDGTLRFWGPLHPGEESLELRYALAADSGSVAGPLQLVRRFETGARRVEILSPHGSEPAAGAGLRAAEPAHVAGRPYARSLAGPVPPGGSLAIALSVPPARAPGAPLALRQSQLWLELDDAALSVDEQLVLELAGDDALPESAGAPLLCLPLPEGVSGLRFSATSLELGLAADPSGALALMGPIPAGRSGLRFRYLLPVGPAPVRLERRYGIPLELFSAFVADTGLLAESDRLHRRQPVRTADRSYLHLEGFQVEADESVLLRLTALAARPPLPALASGGFLALAAAATIGLLVAPLRGPAGPAEAGDPEEDAAATERRAIYAALQDLDHDLETGKLEAADHARMRAELRGRAAVLLRAERSPERDDGAPDAACPGCGAARTPGARFCSQCGVALDADPRAPG